MLAILIVLAATAGLFLLAIWIVVPPPNMVLLPLGVGVPELSPVLLVVALVAGALAAIARKSRATTIARILAGAAILLFLLPFARYVLAMPAFEKAMTAIAATPDAGTGRFHQLAFGELLRGLEIGESRVVRGVEFARPGGSPLTLTVYGPRVKGPFPTIVQIHGGAWQRGGPDEYSEFAEYFASRGYVVFSITYRLAPRWQWPAQIEDVRAALAWIRAHASEYDADIARTALIGRSAGAQLALVAAYQADAGQVASVISVYGPTDLVEGWRVPPRPDPLGIRPVLEAYLGGTPDQRAEQYREASPVTYVSAKVPATLILHGARDHIVEAKFGRQLHERLQTAGATSVLIELPWAEHAFDALAGGLGGQVSLNYIERFLAATIGPSS